jgi:hypothetical protein
MIVVRRSGWMMAGVALAVVVVTVAVHLGPSELPAPKFVLPDTADMALPAPPATVGPAPAIVLPAAERAAIERLRVRGASITVFESGDVLVHFPLGQLEREWRRKGTAVPGCGMGVAHSFTPDALGPPMTDADVVQLDRVSRLTRVNLPGTRVTAQAIEAFRRSHPAVVVEDTDE